MIKKIIYFFLAVISMPAVMAPLAGCNTVEGVGRDIEHGGREISEEAREHRR
jgi:predicted small secreted protein